MIYATQKTPWYRYVLIVPVFASLFLTFSCQPDEEEVTREAVAQSYEEVQAEIAQVDREIRANPAHQQLTEALEDYLNSNPGPPPSQEQLLQELNMLAETDQLKELIARRDALRDKLGDLPDADGVYTVVENQPEPKGGMKAFYQHIGNNMRYPQEARQAGIEGKVFMQFVVDQYGQITQTKVLKGIGGGCDEEATRVLQEAPEWMPGTTDGQAVNVRMVMPITFKLDRRDAPVSIGPSNKTPEANSEGTLKETVVVGYQ